MKSLHIILIALFLSSCASHPAKDEPPIIQRIQFDGARSAFTPNQNPIPQSIIEEPFQNSGGTHIAQFPLTYAVECNTNRSSCKHAIVNTRLEYTAQVTADRSVKLTGLLHSEMGRFLSVTSSMSSGYSQTQSMTIPSEVEVIGEFIDNQRFDRVLRLGEKFELKGLAGAQVILEFH